MNKEEPIKIYFADTLEPQPFDSSAGQIEDPTASTTAKMAGFVPIVKPATILPTPVSTPVVATQVVSDNLNTQARQILGGFTFGRSGALQIGQYVNGSSGDVRITPNGITARNSAGTTTFSLDGTTGNASFLGTISAGSVISATISANNITGQIVNAQIATIEYAKITSVAVTNADIVSINASKITAGDISANRMSANVLTALQVNVSTLSAITANVGTLTSGSITGLTITGGTVRTSSGSGQRVVINGTDNQIEFYDSSNNFCGRLLGLSSAFVITGGDVDKVRFPDKAYFEDTVTIDAGLVVNTISMVGGIDMNGAEISEIKELKFNDTSSNYDNDTWEIWAYNSTEDGFRCRVNGSLYQFDLTSK